MMDFIKNVVTVWSKLKQQMVIASVVFLFILSLVLHLFDQNFIYLNRYITYIPTESILILFDIFNDNYPTLVLLPR